MPARRGRERRRPGPDQARAEVNVRFWAIVRAVPARPKSTFLPIRHVIATVPPVVFLSHDRRCRRDRESVRLVWCLVIPCHGGDAVILGLEISRSRETGSGAVAARARRSLVVDGRPAL
jgi:hypothetical protein